LTTELLERLATNLLLLVGLVAIPLGLLARLRIYPHRRMLALLVLPCLLVLLLPVIPEVRTSVLLIDLAVVLIAIGDAFTLPTAGRFSAQRQLERIASLGKTHQVELLIENRSRRAWEMAIRDDLPEEFEVSDVQFSVRLKGLSRARFQYGFSARRRGAFALEFIHLQIFSRGKLWKRYLRIPVASQVHVYPDMKQLSQYALLARTNRLSLMGVRRSRKVGQDHDFERLRDYTPDDNYKHMDWRATARRRKLTVKQFQTSQSQRIIFLLDCGRMMNNQAVGLSLLDHALNAILMLSHVALRQGDSVGLVCFSDRIHTYVPPRAGMAQMNHLLHASFDRFPDLVESRYDLAFLHLAAHCRKRSLVVLVSNLIDQVNSRQVERYLSLQVGRHLPLGVLLRDHQMFAAVEHPPVGDEQLFQAAAAAEIISWRHDVLTDLEHQGVMVLDLFPEDMTAPLINQYLDIKARHLL
jgi:uncharacterized protein (DUF58 family)